MDESASIEKTTHATREDVEAGAVAYCATAPSSAKRRRPSGHAEHPDQPAPRPEWAPPMHSNSRKKLSAFEKEGDM